MYWSDETLSRFAERRNLTKTSAHLRPCEALYTGPNWWENRARPILSWLLELPQNDPGLLWKLEEVSGCGFRVTDEEGRSVLSEILSTPGWFAGMDAGDAERLVRGLIEAGCETAGLVIPTIRSLPLDCLAPVLKSFPSGDLIEKDVYGDALWRLAMRFVESMEYEENGRDPVFRRDLLVRYADATKLLIEAGCSGAFSQTLETLKYESAGVRPVLEEMLEIHAQLAAARQAIKCENDLTSKGEMDWNR